MSNFQFKTRLAIVVAVANGLVASLAYIITAKPEWAIVATAISVGITSGLSYYRKDVDE